MHIESRCENFGIDVNFRKWQTFLRIMPRIGFPWSRHSAIHPHICIQPHPCVTATRHGRRIGNAQINVLPISGQVQRPSLSIQLKPHLLHCVRSVLSISGIMVEKHATIRFGIQHTISRQSVLRQHFLIIAHIPSVKRHSSGSRVIQFDPPSVVV